MAAAFGWGALGAAALLLGVLIAYQLAPSRQVIAVVMALAPLQPALDQLGDGAGAATALLAPVQVLQELGLDLLGLAPGGLGLPTDLATEPSLAAGEGSRPANTWTWRLPPRFLITLPPPPRCHSIWR